MHCHMEQPTLRPDQIIAQLENLVSKVKLQSPDFSNVGCRVYHQAGSSYLIEISKGRFVRQVTIDTKTVQHLCAGHVDPNLSREIRVAMQTVARRGHDRK
jgi:hypothetical protein